MSESSISSRQSLDSLSAEDWNVFVEKDPFFFVLCACAIARLPQLDDAAQRPEDRDFRLTYELNNRGARLDVQYSVLNRQIILLSRVGHYQPLRHHPMLALILKAQAGWLAEQGPTLFIDPVDDHLTLHQALAFDGLLIGALAVAIGDMLQKTFDWRDQMDETQGHSQAMPPKRFPDFSLVRGV